MMLSPFLLLLLQQPQPTPVLPVRPRDPFVFRCVLDRHPRMITVALGDDMWAAWDAQSCALYKAWKGGVKFDGPVYTAVHGPQPTIDGVDYTTAVDGSAWSATQDGNPVACRVRFGGYHIEANAVRLEWRIALEGRSAVAAKEIVIDEMPELVHAKELFNAEQLDDQVLGEGNQPGLRRIFEAHDVPAGVMIELSMRTDNTVCKLGNFQHERFDDVKDARGVILSTRIFSALLMTHDQPQTGCILFFKPITVEPKPDASSK